MQRWLVNTFVNFPRGLLTLSPVSTPSSHHTYLQVGLYLWKAIHVRGRFQRVRGPDVRVIGPRPAAGLALGCALRGTRLHAVPEVGELGPGLPGGQVGRQRAPPETAQRRAHGDLRRVERVDGQRPGGVRKRRRAVVMTVVLLVLLERRVVTRGREPLHLLLLVAQLMRRL